MRIPRDFENKERAKETLSALWQTMHVAYSGFSYLTPQNPQVSLIVTLDFLFKHCCGGCGHPQKIRNISSLHME